MKLASNLSINGVGTISDPVGNQFSNLASVVSVFFRYVFAFAGIALLLYLLLGGFSYLTAMGDPKKAESGKQKITYAIIGFIVIFAAFWLTQLVDYIFHLGIYAPNHP